MTDSNIPSQCYQYFLQEAPELLGVLEQELFNLRSDYSINKVNNLMRTTHTLKGAAASVGLETIKTVAHSLEDIFKALFNPDLSIDPEVEALIFEGYECLRLPLMAQLTGGQVNESEILDRTAAVFAQLQEKLGDCFTQEVHIPSSLELGFDVTQSIFEVGVSQRLDEMAATLEGGDPVAIASSLRTQSEVFWGLAESLNLPGFGAIAQNVLRALDAHPEQAVSIAQVALTDFQVGQTAVLNGDRSLGGQPSVTLQQWGHGDAQTEVLENDLPYESQLISELQGKEIAASVSAVEVSPMLLQVDPESSDLPVDAHELANQPVGWLSLTDDLELHSRHLQDEASVNPLLENVWGGEVKTGGQEEFALITEEALSTQHLAELKVESSDQPSNQQPRTNNQQPQTDQGAVSPTVRVNVEHLEHLNYAIGELLTNQNRQILTNEQLRAGVKSLVARLQQHQQLLGQLQDWSDYSSMKSYQLPVTSYQQPTTNRFDSLELDRYNQSQILVQSILEDAVQLAEATEAIALFTTQSDQILEKQRQLLTSSRDALMAARMLPLGEIFGRFPRLLEQLSALHNKPVALSLRGTEVLVDKVVAQKLYDPLLHLVRNAFDHGIESPKVRQQRGKTHQGQIEISAYHRGRYLVIEVRDDGHGLDFDQIRQRAVELLFSPERISALNEAQLTDLLFEPGFSTASQVSDLSGRGIGLDVVRAQLQDLQGVISVDSQPQGGTTFTLKIPMSLTLAKLLICIAQDQVYGLFADAIASIVIPQSEQIHSWEGGKALRWGKDSQERLIPVSQLSLALDYFSPVHKPPVSQPKNPLLTPGQHKPIILIRSQEALLGLEVDQLIGEQELVIRPLGSMIVPPSYIYGSSILADGQLTLVLDGATLMQYLLDRHTNNPIYGELVSSPTPLPIPHTPLSLPPAPSNRQLAISTQHFPIPNFIVLLVDDSITLRQTLALTLQKAGYQVLQAKDGYEAIEQIRHQADIQLVICDIEMPRMNGFEFLKYRQQDPALANIPVLMLTSRSGEKHRMIATELGATAYITKPFLEQNLLATVADVISY